MYDADSIALIKTAPHLDGLSSEELPQLLTQAYAEIVAARVRFRDGSAVEHSQNLEGILTRMQKLAFTHEAMVATNINRADRMGAAFVAGSAHHVVLIGTERHSDHSPSYLDISSISPEVSATILFLIAEASSDAAEMAKRIVASDIDSVESSLLKAIKDLGQGRLGAILSASSELELESGESQDVATRVLYWYLLQGLIALARQMRGELTLETPDRYFEWVRSQAVEDLTSLYDDPRKPVMSVYAGPYHLASLLLAVCKEFATSAVVKIPPPSGISSTDWMPLVAHIAEERPFLWTNHKSAIDSGYLEPGTSSVISFPTGAGKSTLSELKIAAALARGVKTVFLAPTLALVDQTAKSLEVSFPNAKVEAEISDISVLDVDSRGMPPISVMTPERCLAIMSFDPSVLSNFGLLVFDECHLLHPRSVEKSRRSVDAMLCLLNFISISPGADILLLSAMMKNAEELAAWISRLNNRKCLPLSLMWKPTRQIRGCVVYNADEVQGIRSRVFQSKAARSTIHPSAALKRSLKIKPYGFFSLHQTWASNARNDYSLLPLLEDEILLAINKWWFLTANANQVSAAIASASIRRKIKTLIFVQTIPFAVATVNAVRSGDDIVTLTADERIQYEIALDEIGDLDALYIKIDEDYNVADNAVSHHGDLLPSERNLHESLFRRPDGIHVVVATSTLAQGMNLPSEMVIISGDSRFDQSAGAMEQLEAHELLNAAGRAGRAGKNSHGMVVIVPSKVTDFNNKSNTIGTAWMDLKAIFSQSDQCVQIGDPFEALLDDISLQSASQPAITNYFVGRLPVGDHSSPDGQDGPTRALLRRSFAAFKAEARGDTQWIESRTAAVLAYKALQSAANNDPAWIERISATTAVPVELIRTWAIWFQNTPELPTGSIITWIGYCEDWIKSIPEKVPELLRLSSLESLLGDEYKALETAEEKGRLSLERLLPLLKMWIAGEPIISLQTTIQPDAPTKKCNHGREFVLKVVSEFSYLFSVPALVHQTMVVEGLIQTQAPPGLECLGRCIREGLDSVEKLAYRHLTRARTLHRRAIHREFQTIAAKVSEALPGEDFGAVIKRVDLAILFD